ncbi:CCA tRNA nucleotidyltransferase, mitochondrial-like [Phalaenopsis equestris]|uniref:CCA tRNA nucleotidyltransferase, mitochondrial-like n=1 Tax=Phalaenopsis equestris TaxID=78828 RepID=UPI0009E2394B|nr:CCA tRNA nucleotidyltransferase, mitochondrial-like [Phalaenopsis equestris]
MAFVSLGSARLLAFQQIDSHSLCFFSTPRIFFFTSRRKLGFRFCGVRCGSGSGAMAAEPRPAVKVRIDLTMNEETIFRRLLDVIDHFKLNTQLRVAGGWVRDKLLGKDCYDIDIALDNMLGREFCEKVNEYLHSTGEEVQGIGVIQCNPDQSKHLETARMCIYSTWIDFVNLRSESYAENSRIPKMKFGTAEEDAYRRDLTINSLFYNINTTSVEDLTGRGVQDLKDGYIVTPLPPRETFLDDPLRVLRAIRFGARFNFKLDEDLKIAASDEEVRDALMSKISRERVGHEIDLMISGNRPVTAMFHICDLQLFHAVFTLPENAQPEVVEGCNRLCVSYMEAALNVLQLIGFSTFSDEQKRLYLYGALFLPLKNTVYTDNKSKKIPVTNFIIRNSLKLKANDAEMVFALHGAVERFSSLLPFLESDREPVPAEAKLEDEFLDIPPASRKRVLAGLLLRDIKSFWRVALLLSTLLHPIDETIGYSRNKESERREIFRKVERIITVLDSYDDEDD